MQETLQSPPRPNGRAQDTDRDLQRTALRDLVALSNDCAQSEQQIRTRFSESNAGNDSAYKKQVAGIEQRCTSLRQQAEQRNEQEKQELASRYESDRASLEEAEQTARQRIEHKSDNILQGLRQQNQQAAWLAESMFEAMENKIAAAYKQAKDQIAARHQEVDSLEVQTAQVLRMFSFAPPPDAPLPEVPEESKSPTAAYEAHVKATLAHLHYMQSLPLPRLFLGVVPFFAAVLIIAVAVAAGQVILGGLDFSQPSWLGMGIGFVLGAVISAGIGIALWKKGRAQLLQAYLPVRARLDAARQTLGKQQELADKTRAAQLADAKRKCEQEVAKARKDLSPMMDKADANLNASLQKIEADFKARFAKVESEHTAAVKALEQSYAQEIAGLDAQQKKELEEARQQYESKKQQIQQQYDQERRELERRWNDGLKQIRQAIERMADLASQPLDGWAQIDWSRWTPPTSFPSSLRFGQMRIDVKEVVENVPQDLPLPETFLVPALLTFPSQGSMLIDFERSGRQQAIDTLRLVMARLLTGLPPGRVRFTIIDPVGLGQNFAGFMHLADHDEALVGSRIWTDDEHIQQRLSDLTEHMETVIQKYLRNEYETIDQYNQQAGELAEPYRFLVIADFPTNFSDESVKRLNSIASSGARCGVYVLIARDARASLPSGVNIDAIEENSVTLVQKADRFVWDDEVFNRFPLTLDTPPADEMLTPMLDIVGRKAKEAKRVEVPFDSIAPKDGEFWSGDCTDLLTVPIGKAGATRQQMFVLGKGVAQHALIAGKTGSGKSTLLHALVTNLAMWYSPEQVEFYLIDFKKGVEFKTYVAHNLPHARAIAVESDREFGLSVLQRLDAELERRGVLFRKAGVQDLASYRKTPGAETLPRTLLIIDEFQEFFSEDDKLAQDASLLLDRLVRQGRAFGIHVILGSQTIGGNSGLPRSTIGQIAVRIALQTSEADSQVILGDNNSAARLLSRPGEAIYNDAGGLIEGNSPFQISWLPEPKREQYLKLVNQRVKSDGRDGFGPPIVFEGNVAADIAQNPKLTKLIRSPEWDKRPVAPLAWIGDPVAIKDPTAVAFRRQSGANAIIIGQQEDAAMGVVSASILSLGAQHPPGSAKFYLLDGTPADSPLAGTLARIGSYQPNEFKNIDYRGVNDAFNELAEELKRRQEAEDPSAPEIYVVLFGLQRYRMLRKSEDGFSFSMSEEKTAGPDQQFIDLLREGPPLGIHVLAWADTPATVERTLDRAALREFDSRILFQMSASDSSNLIDSPAANRLGANRALAFSEEQGTLEKFRPYAVPETAWLEDLKRHLQQKRASAGAKAVTA